MVDVDHLKRLHAALVEARFQGVRRVRDQNGEELSYRSDSELAAAIADLERRIAAARRALPRQVVFLTSKGLFR